MKPITDRIEIIKSTNKQKKNWHGQTVNLWIQVGPEALPEIPESLLIGEERLNVFIERRKSQCFGCGELGHIRSECPKGETVEEKEGVEKRKRGGGRKETGKTGA